MSAAARGAAGWLYLSGAIARRGKNRRQSEAERAAVQLRREREAKEKAQQGKRK